MPVRSRKSNVDQTEINAAKPTSVYNLIILQAIGIVFPLQQIYLSKQNYCFSAVCSLHRAKNISFSVKKGAKNMII